jgi:hypothetical protein
MRKVQMRLHRHVRRLHALRQVLFLPQVMTARPYQRRRVLWHFAPVKENEIMTFNPVFSDNLPIEAVTILYDFARTGAVGNKRDAVRAGLLVLDYASQFVAGEPSAVAGQSPARAGTPELARSALATHLRPLVEAKDEVGRKALAVPWMTIAMLVLQVIEQLLKQQGG